MRGFASVLAVLAVCTAFASGYNGGATVPVHRLQPLDADGDAVFPSSDRPFSLARTCSQCHDTAEMKGAHMSVGTTNAVRTANDEPWFGTEGLTAFEFTKTFGRAFPGGGIGLSTNEVAGDRARWCLTGPLEVNCLACHAQGGFDVSEWARQTARENFRGAAIAAAGLGRTLGMNARLDASWDPERRVNPNDRLFCVPEHIEYDRSKFDGAGRCLFDVGRPKAENCLSCHAAAPVDADGRALRTPGDVHLQRGMTCVDCHTSGGMSHDFKKPSCKDCHMKDGGAGPKPTHEGFPLVHFEKLSCSACHAGITPGGEHMRVRTARANRIGLYGKADWTLDDPAIEEPFFFPDEKGKWKLYRGVPSANAGTGVYWRVVHDVKPARQARGAGDERCAACHSEKGGFFPPSDIVYYKAFNLAFFGRPLFKVVLWTVFGFLCFVAAAGAAAALPRVSKRLESVLPVRLRRFGIRTADWLLCAAGAYLLASGVSGWVTGGMTGWWLMFHMVAGGVFAAAVFALGLLRHTERIEGSAARPLLWTLWALFAAGTVFTAVMPMMAVFGSHGQAVLLWSHRCSSFAFAAASVALCAAVRRAKKNGTPQK